MILEQLYLLQDLNVFWRLLGQKFKGEKEEAGAKIMYEKNVVALYIGWLEWMEILSVYE